MDLDNLKKYMVVTPQLEVRTVLSDSLWSACKFVKADYTDNCIGYNVQDVVYQYGQVLTRSNPFYESMIVALEEEQNEYADRMIAEGDADWV